MIEDKAIFAAFVIIAVITVTGFIGQANHRPAATKVTGFSSTATGTVQFNITGALDITLTDENISFGNGAVSSSADFAWVESTGKNSVNGSWAAANDPFILENTGNVLANITINALYSAASWIGGTNPAVKYNYTNNETGSCSDEGSIASGTWTALPADPSVSGCCQSLNYSDANDALRVDLQIKIPVDASSGYRANAITFSASQSQ